jgi:hypothetical protein
MDRTDRISRPFYAAQIFLSLEPMKPLSNPLFQANQKKHKLRWRERITRTRSLALRIP